MLAMCPQELYYSMVKVFRRTNLVKMRKISKEKEQEDAIDAPERGDIGKVKL